MKSVTAPLQPGATGQQVVDLQAALTELLSQGAILRDGERTQLLVGLFGERMRHTYADATQRAVASFQREGGLEPSGSVDERTAEAINGLLQQFGRLDLPFGGTASLSGSARLQNGGAVAGVTMRLFRRDFGGVTSLLSETTTTPSGEFGFDLEPDVLGAGLEVRAVDPGGAEVLLTTPINDAGPSRAPLHIVAPDSVVPTDTEYARLTGVVTAAIGETGRLAKARETDTDQDLTTLSRRTGWDARLLALAAQAERLAQSDSLPLPASALYGLLRAGLPSDDALLAQVEASTVREALGAMSEAGIVSLGDDEIKRFTEDFASFATKKRLTLGAPGSNSTYAELLDTSGLSAEGRERFAAVATATNAAPIWDRARQAGVDDADIQTLQLHGKLSYLSDNSAPVARLLVESGITSATDLVEQDRDNADVWINDIYKAAGLPPVRLDRDGDGIGDGARAGADRDGAAGDNAALDDDAAARLNAVIPSIYKGASATARAESYAFRMARRVRQSYPTETLVRKLESNPSFRLPADHDAAVTLAKTATGAGFRFGETPVRAFLAEHADVAAAVGADQLGGATAQIAAMQRLYQVTPTHEAIPVLTAMNIQSAHDVVAMSEELFVQLYTHKNNELYGLIGVDEIAHSIYRKSRQVSSVTYNVFTAASKVTSEPAVAGMSAAAEVRDQVRDELIKRYPSLESLFGTMDYCECESCRSVLSPAAYLVDLLQFTDPEPAAWAGFLAQWKANHAGNDYPHVDAGGTALKPYDVLAQRRPDLAQLVLDCSNTNTALPYIDIANEILEYYLVNGQLAPDAANNTGDALSDDLLAEPQHVEQGAYEILRSTEYPSRLPFDLPVATTREFADFAGLSFAKLLETFRTGDALWAPGAPADRFRVAAEQLHLVPTEAAHFADAQPLASWFTLYGFTSEADALAALVPATTIAHRLDVTLAEFTDLITSNFVNPGLAAAGILPRLDLGIAEAKTFLADVPLIGQDPTTLSTDERRRQLEAEAVIDRLTALSAASGVPVADLQAAVAAIDFANVLVLADTNPGASFVNTRLTYGDGSAADPIVFLRLTLFVRLWRATGWSRDELDRALQLFIPADTPFALADGINPLVNLQSQPLVTAIVRLAHLQTLTESLGASPGLRLSLLTMWSDIGTSRSGVSGAKSPYETLFLSSRTAWRDSAFDSPVGRYLTNPAVIISDHLPALRGALRLSTDDVELILTRAGLSLASPLLLPTVSLLQRHAVLASRLSLSIRQLTTLIDLSGLDPFIPVPSAPLTSGGPDAIRDATIAFVTTAKNLRDAAIPIDVLDSLIRDRADATGPLARDRDADLATISSLADGIDAIRSAHPIPADPGSVDLETLRRELGLALAPEVSARLLAMWDGTAEFTVTAPTATALDEAAFVGDPAIRSLSWDPVLQLQSLTVQGVINNPQKAALIARFPLPAGGAAHVDSPVFAQLLDNAEAQAHEFFDAHLLRSAPGVVPATGFLDAADFALLFEPSAAPDPQRAQRARLASTFLPYLRDRLTRQLVIDALVSRSGGDPALVEALLTDRRIIQAAGTPLVDAVSAAATPGVTVRYWSAADAANQTEATATGISTAAGTSAGAWPATADTADFTGVFQVPADGPYRITIPLGTVGTTARLDLPHLTPPTLLSGTATAATDVLGTQQADVVQLKAGIRYRFALHAEAIGTGGLSLWVQGTGLPRQGLEALAPRTGTGTRRATDALVVLDKAIDLVERVPLTLREVDWFATHPTDLGGFDLATLPTTPASDADAAASRSRFGWFTRVLDYARLRAQIAGGTDALIGVFEANATTAADRLTALVYPRLATILRRDATAVAEVASTMFVAPPDPSFADERPIARLWRGLSVATVLGTTAAAVRGWADLADPSGTPTRRWAAVAEVRNALRSRRAATAWNGIARPINDRLRSKRRDALVAALLDRLSLERREQLYEYFLLDPGMEPVVQTSRIRLAIASVQQFVQRCLLNLEKDVHPSAINAAQWEWMKRYRVWEANRKIFLFPENWLEPEFRVDKTHLFTELEGSLLKGDVSDDLVEDAFLAYLAGLDEVARLDIVSMYIEDVPDPAARNLHVLGRSFGSPHHYFLRRFANGVWSAWEPVPITIEGNHVVPVVWRNRLNLFWTTFFERGDETAKPKPTGTGALSALTATELFSGLSGLVATRKVDVTLHRSEFVNGAWSEPESSGAAPVATLTCIGAFSSDSVTIQVAKEPYENGEERGVIVTLIGDTSAEIHLAGRNSSPWWVQAASPKRLPNRYTANTPRATRYQGSGALAVNFRTHIESESEWPTLKVDILRQLGNYLVVPCANDLTSIGIPADAYANASNPAAVKAALERGLGEIVALAKPVFYQDDRYTFFVQSQVSEKTVEEWNDWVPWYVVDMVDTGKNNFVLTQARPYFEKVDDPYSGIDIHSILEPEPGWDWLNNPATVLLFDGVAIGAKGQVGLQVVDEETAAGPAISARAGSGLNGASALVVSDPGLFASAGLADANSGLNVVGVAGLSATLAENVIADAEHGFGINSSVFAPIGL